MSSFLNFGEFIIAPAFSARANTFLIVGLNDAGKTLTFSKLINSENRFVSYMSIKENVYHEYLAKNGTVYSLVDIPGSESLCKSFLQNWLFRERKNVKGIIFVIDSATFTEKSKDVAVLLYDILYDTAKSIPILIACNKQDNQLKAKSSKIIEVELEKELSRIQITRGASLSSTSGDSVKKLLTKSGDEFLWAKFNKKCGNILLISFMQCCALDDGKNLENEHLTLNAIRKWIDLV